MKFEPTPELVEEAEKEIQNPHKQKESIINNQIDSGADSRIGEIARNNAVNSILNTDDYKWDNLRKQAFTLGGYVGAGFLSFQTAYNALSNAINQKDLGDYDLADKTLISALNAGIAHPFDRELKEKERQEWLDENYQVWSRKQLKEESKINQQTNQKPKVEEPVEKVFDFEGLAFSLEKVVEKPIAIISSSEGDTISTAGNITLFTGQQKTGKSAINAAILAGGIAPEGIPIDTLGLNIVYNKANKAVLHFDTEQTEYDHYKFCKGVYNRAERNYDLSYFKSFHILDYSKAERFTFIEKSTENYAKKCGGIFIIIIDGIGDLIDTMDLKECELVIDNIRKLGKKYNCPIITILHQNPGTTKERGHMGSELLRKAESVMEIQREGTISKLIGKSFRNCGEIPEVQFEYNTEKGYHTLVEIITQQSKREAKERAKELNSKKKKLELYNEFDSIFKDRKPMKNADICRKYMEIEACSTSTANRRIRDATTAGVLLKVKSTGLYHLDFISFSL